LTGGGEANIDPSPGNALGQLNFSSNSSSMLIGWKRTAGSGETDFISNQEPGGSGGFAFYNHDNSNLETQLLWIRGDSNVSIGTPDPHGYKLAVNGNIRAREIKVEAGPWPDYVFRPDYHLPSLNHVKTYIDHNGHLPDMPSALEVDKQGVNLGKMNRLLG